MDTRCRLGVLRSFSYQVGEAELPLLEPDDYTIEVYALEFGGLLWDDEFSVGVTAAIPTMSRWAWG